MVQSNTDFVREQEEEPIQANSRWGRGERTPTQWILIPFNSILHGENEQLMIGIVDRPSTTQKARHGESAGMSVVVFLPANRCPN